MIGIRTTGLGNRSYGSNGPIALFHWLVPRNLAIVLVSQSAG